MKNWRNKLLYHLGLFSVLFVGYVIFCASVVLLANQMIHPVIVPASVLFTLLTLMLKIRREKTYWLKLVVIWLVLFVIALVLCGWVYDVSWDGNAYHKGAVGYLAQGWNPLYQTMEEFVLQSDMEGVQQFTSLPWVEFFPKASWLFGASIYAVTGNIETAKVINVIIAFCVFAYSWEFFNQRLSGIVTARDACANHGKGRFLIQLLFCTVCAANPIAVNQILVFYVDGLLASGITLLFLCLLNLSWNKRDFSNAEEWLWLFPTILLLCNLKFTSLGITAVFCAMFYFFWLGREWVRTRSKGTVPRWKDIRTATIFYVAVVLCSVVIVGATSYVRNTVVWGHPFHPIMGPNATSSEAAVMGGYLPENVADKSAIEKWFLVFFSKTKCAAHEETPIQLKIPFTFTADELNVTTIDTERAGFGFLYSGIFLVSLAVSALEIWAAIKHKEYEEAVLLGTIHGCWLVLVSIVSASWLARYSPYLFVPVVLAQILLLRRGNFAAKAGFVILSGMILLNSLTLAIFPAKQIKQSVSMHAAINQIKNTTEPVVMTCGMCGPLFNLMDEDVNYVVVDELPGESKTIADMWLLNYSVP